jgi:hypothetical protein
MCKRGPGAEALEMNANETRLFVAIGSAERHQISP